MTNKPPAAGQKPQRLYKKTYLQLIKNSVGSEMFRNFYVRPADGGAEFDALDDGSNSCAFYVSAVLVIFGKLGGVHGTVAGTVEDLQASGWELVNSPAPGDVLVWQAVDFADGCYEHIGFFVGGNMAISTSMASKQVARHELHFGEAHRPLKQIFRMNDWQS